MNFSYLDGEVCPAGWDPKKNTKTMVPDPTSSKDYFSSVD